MKPRHVLSAEDMVEKAYIRDSLSTIAMQLNDLLEKLDNDIDYLESHQLNHDTDQMIESRNQLNKVRLEIQLRADRAALLATQYEIDVTNSD